MADEKKGPKKDDKKGGGGVDGLEIAILVILIILVAIVWGVAPYFFKTVEYISNSGAPAENALKTFIGVWQGIAIPITLVLGIIFTYSTIGLLAIRHKEHEKFKAHVEAAYEDETQAAANGGSPELTIRWRKILELVESSNQNDWRQAIVDADTVLDEILAKGGFIGDSLGERLTNATKADFKTLDHAWEAHKVRNQIAHEGSSFQLSQPEAKRIINLYKHVFEEFYFI